ncbi:hypothetical protein [Dickeya oryzae]|uniref:hypothetical protein n=1 Tax=Dickeya oryzae TaxID=1240404 RepID=UPI000B1C1860|nr:hypothetical protein [Dickeya oryzae]MCA6992962.1 hypothetical protein [Dickeya oryzae]
MHSLARRKKQVSQLGSPALRCGTGNFGQMAERIESVTQWRQKKSAAGATHSINNGSLILSPPRSPQMMRSGYHDNHQENGQTVSASVLSQHSLVSQNCSLRTSVAPHFEAPNDGQQNRPPFIPIRPRKSKMKMVKKPIIGKNGR